MSSATRLVAARILVARLLGGATAVYMNAIVFATHYPKPERFLPSAATSDKLLHFLAYGLLAVLAGGALAAAGRWTLKSTAVLGAGLMAFGVIDEVTQPLFPPRTTDFFDWVADCIGLVIGLVGIALVVLAVRRWRKTGGYRQLGVGAR